MDWTTMSETITFGTFPRFPGAVWTTRWMYVWEAGDPQRPSRPRMSDQLVTYEALTRDPDALRIQYMSEGSKRTHLVRARAETLTLDGPNDPELARWYAEPFLAGAARWLSGRRLRVGDRATGIERARRVYLSAYDVRELTVELSSIVVIEGCRCPVLLERVSYRDVTPSGKTTSISYETSQVLDPWTGLLLHESRVTTTLGVGSSSISLFGAYDLSLRHSVQVEDEVLCDGARQP
jgi:hypothetical protein